MVEVHIVMEDIVRGACQSPRDDIAVRIDRGGGFRRFQFQMVPERFIICGQASCLAGFDQGIILVLAVAAGETHGDSAGFIEEAFFVQPGAFDRFHQHLKGSILGHSQFAVHKVNGHAFFQLDADHFALFIASEHDFVDGHRRVILFDAHHVALVVHIEYRIVGQPIGGHAGGGIVGDFIIRQHIPAGNGIGVLELHVGIAVVLQCAGHRDGDHPAVHGVQVAAFLQHQIHASVRGFNGVQVNRRRHGQAVIHVDDPIPVQFRDLFAVDLGIHNDRRHAQMDVARGGHKHIVVHAGALDGVGRILIRRDDPEVEIVFLSFLLVEAVYPGRVVYMQFIDPQRADGDFRFGHILLVHGDGIHLGDADQVAALFSGPGDVGRTVIQQHQAVQPHRAFAAGSDIQLLTEHHAVHLSRYSVDVNHRFFIEIRMLQNKLGSVFRVLYLFFNLFFAEFFNEFFAGFFKDGHPLPVMIHARIDKALVLHVHVFEDQIIIGFVCDGDMGNHGLVEYPDCAAVQVGVQVRGARQVVVNIGKLDPRAGFRDAAVSALQAHLSVGSVFADIHIDACRRPAQIQVDIIRDRGA